MFKLFDKDQPIEGFDPREVLFIPVGEAKELPFESTFRQWFGDAKPTDFQDTVPV